jgi:aspartate aminotransferase
LRRAIAEKLKRENGLDYDFSQIVVSNGAKQSIANAVLCLVDPGDEVIIPSPYWVTYAQIVELAGGVPVFVETGIGSDFKVSPAQIEKAITGKSKLFMFSSPCNPTGTVYTHEELRGLAEVFAKHRRVHVLSDEIYEHIIFEGKHASIAAFENIRDRVALVNGVSKSFAMTGWRIGYMAASVELAGACDRIQGQFTSGAGSISQRAALAAIAQPNPEGEHMLNAFRRRRDLVLKLLEGVPGWKVNRPQGAFYVFPDVSACFGKKAGKHAIQGPNELCIYLLEEAKVGLVTGEAFGDSRCVRLSYATSDKLLIEAIGRIKAAVERLG